MVWMTLWMMTMTMMVNDRKIYFRAINKCNTLGIPDEEDPDDDNDGIPDLGIRENYSF